MRKYLTRKLIIYLLTFFFAVTIDWLIPRLIPGNPVENLVSRFASMPAEARQTVTDYFNSTFGFDVPVWKQYLNFWAELFHGNLGLSITMFPKPVMSVISEAALYSLILLIPCVLMIFWCGNKLGALASVNKKVDNILMSPLYVFTSTPQFWLGILLIYIFAIVFKIFPSSGAYSYTMLPSFSLTFIIDYIYHMILPFLSLFIIETGGQAIGMRNLILYELGSNYSKYMESMGCSKKMIRRYAYRNSILPQVSGLAIAIGQTISGQIILESIFNYPGIGYRIFMSITSLDYFLMQGCFLFIVIAMLVANFTVDIVYMLIDPQVRHSYAGEV